MENEDFDNIDWFRGEDFKTINIPKLEQHTFDVWFDSLSDISHKAHGNKHAELQITLRTLKQIEYYFSVKRKENGNLTPDSPDIIHWISKTLEKHLSQAKTARKNQAIGAITHSIYILAQADDNEIRDAIREAIAAWLGKCEKTVRNSYNLFMKSWPRDHSLHLYQIIINNFSEIVFLINERDTKYFVHRKYTDSKKKEDIKNLEPAFKKFCDIIDEFNQPIKI